MNIGKLEEAFFENSEVEVARLMTCNFDLAAFSLVEKNLPDAVADLFKNVIKFRTHLSMEQTSLTELSDKIAALLSTQESTYTGTANKICGYSGILLTDSKSFMGTPEELVSHNEAAYVIKMYPWWIKAINPKFAPYVDQYAEKAAFFYTDGFDIDSLKDKTDVLEVTDKEVILEGKIKLPIIKVES